MFIDAEFLKYLNKSDLNSSFKIIKTLNNLNKDISIWKEKIDKTDGIDEKLKSDFLKYLTCCENDLQEYLNSINDNKVQVKHKVNKKREFKEGRTILGYRINGKEYSFQGWNLVLVDVLNSLYKNNENNIIELKEKIRPDRFFKFENQGLQEVYCNKYSLKNGDIVYIDKWGRNVPEKIDKILNLLNYDLDFIIYHYR